MLIRPRNRSLVILFGALMAVVAITGCSKRVKVQPPPPAPTQPATPAPTPTPTPTPTPAPTPGPSEAERNAEALRSMQIVYFEYDSFTLSDAARAALDGNAKLLRANATLAVTLEGHCDERGTVEYNQALGQKRAEAIGGIPCCARRCRAESRRRAGRRPQIPAHPRGRDQRSPPMVGRGQGDGLDEAPATGGGDPGRQAGLQAHPLRRRSVQALVLAAEVGALRSQAASTGW